MNLKVFASLSKFGTLTKIPKKEKVRQLWTFLDYMLKTSLQFRKEIIPSINGKDNRREIVNLIIFVNITHMPSLRDYDLKY